MIAEYSLINNYYIIYSENSKQKKITALLPVRAGKNQKAINKILRNIGKNHRQKLTTLFQFNGISIQINTLDANVVQAIVSDITLQFWQAGYGQTCMLSNAESNLSLYKMGKELIVANDVAIMNHVNKLNQDNALEINPIMGLIGGVLGISIGIIPWILLAYFGWFSAWLGFLIVILGVLGFRLLGKGITKNWGIVILVLSLFAIVFAQFCSLGLGIYQAFKDEMRVYLSLTEILVYIPLFLSESETRLTFITHLLVALGLGGVGMFSFIKNIPTKEERSVMLQYSKIE